MRRVYKLTALVLIVGLLGGCYAPYVAPPPPDPYPYSFSDDSKPLYLQTTEGARRFIADARELWFYETNNIVLQPSFCATYFRGDCDDFATMLAHYLQEYWGYDTYIVFIRDIYSNVDHAVCFFAPNNGLTKLSYCTNRPIIIDDGCDYYPVDWAECPGWMWYGYGGTKRYSPAAWIYSYYLHDWYPSRAGGFLEWYEMVHSDLSILPPEDSSHSFDGSLPTPAAVFDEGFP